MTTTPTVYWATRGILSGVWYDTIGQGGISVCMKGWVGVYGRGIGVGK